MFVKNFKHLMELAIAQENKTIAVIAAADLDTLTVVENAEKINLASFILIGDVEKMHTLIEENQLTIQAEMIEEANNEKATELAVDMVCEGTADTIMKGNLQSSTFLRGMLNKQKCLNNGSKITQISVLEKPNADGLLMITDCAISMEPDLMEKKAILENAVKLAHKTGVQEPKVAVLAPVEVVNPAIQDSVDAAILSKMNDRGQITGCIVDGPLAFDNAISKEAAETKGIKGPVAGQADVILVPNLSVGNALTKSITYIAEKEVIGATVGTRVPVVFTSRTESIEGKLLSIALTVYTI